MKGRNISENVLLAQKIMTDIRKKDNFDNVVIKLDMANTYDRVEWRFLMKVLHKIGFDSFFWT